VCLGWSAQDAGDGGLCDECSEEGLQVGMGGLVGKDKLLAGNLY
jgi:hypothetical protein